MENPAANHLPEVDSLPDGFVESSEDLIAVETPMHGQDKPLADHKYDNVTNLDRSSDLGNVSDLDANKGGMEEAPNVRSFPVSLSETDRFVDSAEAVEEPYKGYFEQRECASDVTDTCCKEKIQVEGQSQSFQRCNEGGSDTQATHTKEIFSLESTGAQKHKKLETSDVKRKNAKRTFKSEKEFLEFTLKYQQVLSERDGAIAVRDKLESLCRELQRQNKMLMDECKRVSTEGQNLRLDLSNKFQDAIKDVSNKLEEQNNGSLSQLKENEMLRNKLKQFADQYTLTEQQFTQKLKQKTLELQIADLKIKQHEEKSIQEQSQMKLYAEQVSQLLATEKNLRLQLTADGEKFQQFQEALVKSNEVFETLKQEIEKMAKSIKELKKENTFLKSKSEKSDVTLIELVEERERLKKQLEKMKKQKEKLESLCRSLQAERKQNETGSISSDPVHV